MSNLTPPPERDLSPQRRQAVRAALHDERPGSRRTPLLAAAAVAAIVAAGLVIPQLRSGDRPEPAGPATSSTPTTATPRRAAIPTRTTQQRPGTPPDRLPPVTRQSVKDPVTVCREEIRRWLGPDTMPGGAARVAGRIDGQWGVTLVLADTRRWVGCDTTRYTYSGKASLLRPRPTARPAVTDIDAYKVSSQAVNEPFGATLDREGAIYEHYFAAGVLPEGVAAIRYQFPDGAAETAVLSGDFWLVEHLEPRPIRRNQSSSSRERITVELLAADGSLIRRHRLDWGTHTCAHINHGC